MALKDQEGNVTASIPGIAKQAELSIEETQDAIKYLESPDSHSRFGEQEGRRIIPLEGRHGWHVVSHDHYRDKIKEHREKLGNRERQAKHREKRKAKGHTYKTYEERVADGTGGE